MLFFPVIISCIGLHKNSLTDISENSNIGWTTLHRIWDKLEKFELVIFTREIGRAKLFKLNEENQSVKALIRLYDTLLHQETENKHLHEGDKN